MDTKAVKPMTVGRELNKALLEIKKSAEFWTTGIDFLVCALYNHLQITPEDKIRLIEISMLSSPLSLLHPTLSSPLSLLLPISLFVSLSRTKKLM